MNQRLWRGLRSVVVFSLIFCLWGCSKKNLDRKVLHVVARDNIKSGDPATSYDVVALDIVSQIYEGLYQYDYYSDRNAIVPLLAQGMPVISPDGLTWTIKIKKGIRFQDDPGFVATSGVGREVTAADFIFAWKRHADPTVESMGNWIFEKKVSEMIAVDRYTLRLRLARPYPQLLNVLTTVFTAPLPEEVVRHYGKEFHNHPVGTGPFKVKTWRTTSRIVLVRNENFHDEFFPTVERLSPQYKKFAEYAGKKLPFVDEILFEVLKEEQPAWLGFLAGLYDQVKIPKDNFDSVIENGDQLKADIAERGIHLSIEPALSIWYVSLNLKDSILGKNKYLRQAIASTIDRQTWLRLFKNGRGSIQEEVTPPSATDRCGKPYAWAFDLARARALLKKAGHPEGKGLGVLRFDTQGAGQAERQGAELMVKNLQAIGLQVELVLNTLPGYLDKWSKGNLQLSKGSWVADYTDSENFYQLLYGPNGPPGPNEANFDHPEYNKLYQQIARMKPGPERRRLICRMEEIVQEEVPWAYGVYEDEYRLLQPWLKNYRTAELVQNKYKYVDVVKGLPKNLMSRN